MQSREEMLECERILGEGLREFAAELRMLEACDLVAFLRTERLGNVEHLVHSAAELYLKPGVLHFGRGGEAELPWGGVPVVSLNLEFRNAGTVVYFRLILEEAEAAVAVDYMTFEGARSDSDDCAGLLRAAVDDARQIGIRLPDF